MRWVDIEQLDIPDGWQTKATILQTFIIWDLSKR
jgi:hypothetical protein